MNAQPSFEPPVATPQRRSTARSSQLDRLQGNPISSNQTVATPRRRSRTKLNPVYAHRRQGVESALKLVTYSALSIFGIVTLIDSISYNWAQQGKLQHLETEVQDAKIRAEKISHNFGHSFDPQAQKTVMEDNSYKIAPDRRQVIVINPRVNYATQQASK